VKLPSPITPHWVTKEGQQGEKGLIVRKPQTIVWDPF